MPLRRYLILLSAVAASICLGSTYSWSVFVTPIKAQAGIGQGMAQLPFSMFYVVFPLTLVGAGMALARLGPRRLMILGGLCFGGGWTLASLGRLHFGFTVAGIGVLGGVGVGLAYIVPIATCILWFPRHKGLITGVAVAGFGGGAALISQVANHLIAARGWSPYEIFRLLGLIYIVVLTLAGAAMANPPGFIPRPARPGDAGGVLRDRAFRMLYLAMFAGLVAGLTVNGNMKQLYRGGGQAGLYAVQIFALMNALGRVFWGFVFDRVRAATAIRANLAIQAVVLLGAFALLKTPAGLYAFALLAGLCYGGVLVLYASSAARIWGPERLGPIYGWLFSANIPAALGPMLAGRAFDHWGSFAVPLGAIGILLLLATTVVREAK